MQTCCAHNMPRMKHETKLQYGLRRIHERDKPKTLAAHVKSRVFTPSHEVVVNKDYHVMSRLDFTSKAYT